MVDKINSSAKPIEITDKINEIIDDIPDVGNGTITIKQDDEVVGIFNLNQKTNMVIELAGASGIVDQEFDPTSIRPQSGIAIAGERYLKEHQDISHLQLKSNLVTELTENSTDTQYPSAKVVYNKIKNINSEAHGDWEYHGPYLVSVSSTGLINVGDEYLPQDSETYWYEILMHVEAYDDGDGCISYFRNICLGQDITIARVSGYGRRSQDTFIMAFPPGSRSGVLPVGRRKTDYELGHLMKLTRNKKFYTYRFVFLGYRRLGKTPFNYPTTDPDWVS